MPDPGGPPLWVGLTVDELKDLVKYSAAELCRVYSLKSKEPTERFRYSPLDTEIKFWEQAHDNHFRWLREKSAKPIGFAG
ncbi:MAG: hypothetical protein A4E20_10785 [Nitrospira sp. SG-bin2]|uniref:hypothetical protein n=1 Tax=Nitrospira cf. moscoviensis SBR1015 TaxID=96242 RepID=UPI000A0E10D0|nr:hypothetical protein [Nitrospira cf. moscoviensis SBR1015]OQW34497.1 MAG: hypothetical protein A4E20_10785 [Nitrospira sp. SG-bin2]